MRYGYGDCLVSMGMGFLATSFCIHYELINVSAGQQLICGVLMTIIGLVWMLFTPRDK